MNIRQCLRIISLIFVFSWPFCWHSYAEEKTQETSVSYPDIWPLLHDQWSATNAEPITYDAPPETYGLSETKPIPLSLRESVLLALSGNLDLSAQRYIPRIAETGIANAKGVYDFHLTSNAAKNVSRTPISSILQTTDTNFLELHTTSFDIGINRMVQTGGRMELKLDMLRYKSNSSYLILNPSYATHLNFSVAQPILKNAGLAFHQASIRIAQNLHLMSQDNFREFVANMVGTIEQAYWDLVFAFQNLEVRKESLALAKDLLKKNEIQIKIGTMAPIEILQAKTGVALREEDLLTSENLMRRAQDRFKDLLQISQAPLHSSILIVPTETPQDPPQQEETSLEQDIKVALSNRSEFHALRKDLENKNLQIKIAENQMLPSLDVTGSIGLNGLGGTSIEATDYLAFTQLDPLSQLLILFGAAPYPTATSPFDGGLHRSFKELWSTDFYQWALGVRFDIPLENRSAKSNYLRAKLEAYQTSVSLKSLEEKIILEIQEANRAIQTSRRRITTSQVSRQLAREQLVAEQKRLAVGLSTNYQVLKMEEDLREAETHALKARIDYWKAKVMLEQARGTLLEKENIRLEDLPLRTNDDTA